MVQRRKKTDAELEEEEFEEEYDSIFNKASTGSDNSFLFIGGLAGLAALTGVIGTLSTTELEEVRLERETVTAVEIPTVETEPITNFLSENTPEIDNAIQVISDAENLAPEELSHLTQMMEEGKQYGRASDPKTAENITFNHQSQIAEQTGMFGGVEAEKQGRLQCYADQPVIIPWVTCEDDGTCDSDGPVCDDCLDLRDEGPYSAANFPEAPHYGCRCKPGDPILDLSDAELPDI